MQVVPPGTVPINGGEIVTSRRLISTFVTVVPTATPGSPDVMSWPTTTFVVVLNSTTEVPAAFKTKVSAVSATLVPATNV